MSWSSPARRVSDDVGVGEPDLAGRGGGEIGDAARVPGEVRRPQVGEVGDGFEGVVDLRLGEPRPQAGFGVDERDPVGLVVGCRQQVVRVAAELVDDVRDRTVRRVARARSRGRRRRRAGGSGPRRCRRRGTAGSTARSRRRGRSGGTPLPSQRANICLSGSHTSGPSPSCSARRAVEMQCDMSPRWTAWPAGRDERGREAQPVQRR